MSLKQSLGACMQAGCTHMTSTTLVNNSRVDNVLEHGLV